ncbi:hypothetical protein [Acinetobacter pseudolwoffii]|uniref:hypothetical protein n=1 Tax=Acinetobacter pseudolwoffii TaxID=2053287 RepID=UPI0021E4AF5C|nr:hypothetical protein [Acinetobacter pseudolwoffii]
MMLEYLRKIFFTNDLVLNNNIGEKIDIKKFYFFSFCEIQSKIIVLPSKRYKVFIELEYGTLSVLLDEENFKKLQAYSLKNDIPFRELDSIL